jgi:chorismate dehydratase
MILAKIDFINLLPFDIFCKKFLHSHHYQIMQYKQNYPTKINQYFKNKKINASFISSIEALKYIKFKKIGAKYFLKYKNNKLTAIAIVAKSAINSVLCIKNGKQKQNTLVLDKKSATSNALAKILKLEGKILIGDDALRYYHKHINEQNNFIDLAQEYKNKYSLPFVFALFVANNNFVYTNNLAKTFVKTNIKLPYYVLNKTANNNNLSIKQIKLYLKLVTYKIGHKEIKSLKLFKHLLKDIV